MVYLNLSFKFTTINCHLKRLQLQESILPGNFTLRREKNYASITGVEFHTEILIFFGDFVPILLEKGKVMQLHLWLVAAVLLALCDFAGGGLVAASTSTKELLFETPIFVGDLGNSLDSSPNNSLNSLVSREYIDSYWRFTTAYSTLINSNADAATVMMKVSIDMKSQYINNLVNDIRDAPEDYKRAFNYMLTLPDSDRLTVEMILDIHKILCRNDEHALPGRFRQGSVGFGRKLVNYVFLQHEQIPEAMKAFVDRVNHELLVTDNIDIWGKLAWLHYRFVYIHPFNDGNGRMSSILVNWLLMKVYKSPLPVNLYESQQIMQLKYVALNYADARLLSKLYLQRLVGNYRYLFMTYRASLVSNGYDDMGGLSYDVQEDTYGEIDEDYDSAEFIGVANNFIHPRSLNIPYYDTLPVSEVVITTIAGTGTGSYSGDDGAATSATLNYPWGLTTESGIAYILLNYFSVYCFTAPSGKLYIADYANHRIRKLRLSTGIITTIAGSSTSGSFSGDGGAATSAALNGPRSAILDTSGTEIQAFCHRFPPLSHSVFRQHSHLRHAKSAYPQGYSINWSHYHDRG